VLLVPYQRRKRVDMMLRGAKIAAEWIQPPTREDIRRNDRTRLLEALLQPVEADEEDLEVARKLLAEKSAEDIAVALVRAHRARMPAPEELADQQDGADQGRQGHRQGFEDTVWFHMDVGRRHNADPRWLLPLLCRRGHITRNEIGAIRIAPNETAFEIPRAAAGRFMAAVKRTAGGDPDGEGAILIEPMQGTPRDTARQNKRQGPPPVRHKAKPAYKAKGPPRGR
jgi:ATP-dependent RNA helicase DeaD